MESNSTISFLLVSCWERGFSLSSLQPYQVSRVFPIILKQQNIKSRVILDSLIAVYLRFALSSRSLRRRCQTWRDSAPRSEDGSVSNAPLKYRTRSLAHRSMYRKFGSYSAILSRALCSITSGFPCLPDAGDACMPPCSEFAGMTGRCGKILPCHPLSEVVYFRSAQQQPCKRQRLKSVWLRACHKTHYSSPGTQFPAGISGELSSRQSAGPFSSCCLDLLAASVARLMAFVVGVRHVAVTDAVLVSVLLPLFCNPSLL
jgi:hypothetical protein